jgi:enoyl-CoA hydratase/3-hydroxyacyl-CoA dehydrogenase
MKDKFILYEEKNAIAYITLNRPEVLNALNKKLWHGIFDCLNKAEKSKAVRAVIITGAGRAFSAGDDIKEVASLKSPKEVKDFFLNHAAPAITKIIELSKPVIAAVNGIAYGGGCEIAMLCDLVVASENAKFAIPEALIGAIPPIATAVGAYILGKLNLNMLMLTGEPITAHQAKFVGLVNEVVPAQELIIKAEELAQKTMRASPLSVKIIKMLVNKQLQLEGLRHTVNELVKIIQTNEGRKGHKAFLEKRMPCWFEH